MKKTGFGFAGFSMGSSQAKKPFKPFSEDDDDDDKGFDDGEEVKEPAPAAKQDDDEVDPLDAFMAGVQAEVEKATTAPAAPKARIAEFEDEDPVESYIKHKQAVGKAAAAAAAAANVRISSDDTDEDVYAAAKAVDGDGGYDSDEIMTVKGGKKIIEPIPALDHSQIQYAPFEKCFYTEDEDINLMTEQEVDDYRKELEIKITGPDPIRPVKSFAQLGFEETLASDIAKQGYTEPTPIQRQALPVALSGRDIIGIAQTGSGKTAAFVLPMIVHIMDQPELEKGEGPIAVICAPTRELAQQIYVEAKKFAKSYGIRVAAIYGGLSKNDQFRELKAGTEVVVATPGRLIDMIKSKACKMNKTTYLVLDEADRMFDMGFEPQVRSIVGQIRPDRQTLLFSATFKRSVEKLARDILIDPLRINIGSVGEANVDIKQEIIIVNSDAEKWPWLMPKLQAFVDEGSVIIFVSTKLASEELSKNLISMGFHSAALHGDKDQTEREKIMFAFKNENLPILVATDVAARGLDIKTIRNVVNYDVARDIDSHTHRIGRTGRAGQLGVAWTLITPSQTSFACELLRSLELAGQIIPPELTQLAMQDSRFRARGRSGGRGGGGGRGAGGGRGGAGGGRGRGTRGPTVGGAGLGFDDDADSGPSNSEGGVFGRGRGAVLSSMRGAMTNRFKSSFVRADAANEEDGGALRANKVARLIPPVNPAEPIQSYDQQQSYSQQPPAYSQQQQQSYAQQQQSYAQQSQQPQQRTHKYDNERYNNLPFTYSNQIPPKQNFNNRYQNQPQNLPPQTLQVQQQINQRLAQQSANEAYDPFSAGDNRDRGRDNRDSRDRDRDRDYRDRDRDRDYRDRDRDRDSRDRDRDRDRDYRDRDRERDRDGDRDGDRGRKRSSAWDK
eukprot:Phypoly_transcript_02543.p1 GENE.Phypoly_transcript_02543~~Phypoly_transcript_02543.p1  ORF type:complete len:897 (+),score=184.99 Phypoly_transcript_02543:35-2725(+)